MDLTTVTDVKELLRHEDNADDEVIRFLIEQVSAEIQSYLNRTMQTASYTEFFDVYTHVTRVFLKAYPVSLVTGAWNDTSREFLSTTVVAATNYYVNLELGSITFDKTYLSRAPGALKVTYTGGMGLTTEAFIAAYHDLFSAATTEAAYRFQRRFQVGVVNVALSGSTVSVPSKNQFLPQVEEVIRPYMRVFG